MAKMNRLSYIDCKIGTCFFLAENPAIETKPYVYLGLKDNMK